jgi:hypothetical protein
VATVSDEVAVSADATTGDELATTVEVPSSVGLAPLSTVDDDTSGVLTSEIVVLVATSVDVATCANTRVTVAVYVICGCCNLRLEMESSVSLRRVLGSPSGTGLGKRHL